MKTTLYLLVIVLLVGCASTGEKVEEVPVIYDAETMSRKMDEMEQRQRQIRFMQLQTELEIQQQELQRKIYGR